MNKYWLNLVAFLAIVIIVLVFYHGGIHKDIPRASSVETFATSESLGRLNLSEISSEKKQEKIDTKSAVLLAQGVLNLIRHRYELGGIGSQFFLTANNIGSHSWDVIKYKFAKKILDGDKYLMIFGGSSVTASHDNYYNQSYPAVVSRRLGPILQSLGVELQVHNIAQGLYQKLFDTKNQYIDCTIIYLCCTACS